MSDEDVTATIIDAVITVHNELGPGFLESVYQNALVSELQRIGLKVDREKQITITYRDEIVGLHRLDLLVEDRVVVEVKAVEALGPAHYAQIRSYLKSSRTATGLLVNFAGVRADFRRVVMA